MKPRTGVLAVAVVVGGLALIACLPEPAVAGGSLHLGIGIGIPLGGHAHRPPPWHGAARPYPYRVYAAPSVYVMPAPVYMEPAPVYYPPPVVVQPAPAAPTYYAAPPAPQPYYAAPAQAPAYYAPPSSAPPQTYAAPAPTPPPPQPARPYWAPRDYDP